MILLSLLLACGEPQPAAVVEAPAPAGTEAGPSRAPVVSPSLYEMDLDLVDQAGVSRELDLDRGHPVLVAMFYSSCPQACPMLIEKIQAVEASLDPAVRDDVRVLMVSLDPDRDDPAALSALAERHGLDSRWTLARVPEDQVRDLAAVLDVAYRKLPSGDFNHASVVTLLDREGRVVTRLDGVGSDAAPMTRAIRELGPAS